MQFLLDMMEDDMHEGLNFDGPVVQELQQVTSK